jgi:hypothetical protein
MEIEINNIDDLLDFILQTKLNEKEVNEVINNTLKVIVFGEYEKKELAKLVKEFYNKYSSLEERPLFLDLPNDEINVKDFSKILFKEK